MPKSAAADKGSIPLQKDNDSQSHPTSFLKIVEKGPLLWGRIEEKVRQLVKFGGDQSSSFELSPRTKRKKGAKEISVEEQ